MSSGVWCVVFEHGVPAFDGGVGEPFDGGYREAGVGAVSVWCFGGQAYRECGDGDGGVFARGDDLGFFAASSNVGDQ